MELGDSDDAGRAGGSVLVFTGPGETAEYAPWQQVRRIDLDRTAAALEPLL